MKNILKQVTFQLRISIFCSAVLLTLNMVHGSGLNLPEYPDYPAPVERFESIESGPVFFRSHTPVDFASVFRGDLDDETVVKGDFRIPDAESFPARTIPAMVILHGSGGISKSREIMYAEYLAENGIATLLVDSYASRGVEQNTPYGLRVLAVSEADMLCDAYSALRILQTHPRIDPERIAVMGFSYGGLVTRFCLDSRFHEMLGEGLNPFALHIDFYSPTYMDINTKSTTGAPYLTLRGALDNSADRIGSVKIEDRIRKAGSSVGTRLFSEAGHAWEFDTTQKYRESLNPVACFISVEDDGSYVFNGETYSYSSEADQSAKRLIRARIVAGMAESCMGEGYVIGRNDRARMLAKDALLEAIESELMPKKVAQEQVASSQKGMVVAPERFAAEAGLEVLREGGNAVDAAVTVGFALAVTYPQAGNIGGGGFMLVYDSEKKETVAIDYREKAPKAATRDMFLNPGGKVNNYRSRYSYKASGVPGTVRGLELALQRYGTISIERALRPAVELAERGFPMSDDLNRLLKANWVMKRLESPSSKEAFYNADGIPAEPGQLFVQPDLAKTLKQIQKFGSDGFYRGEVAELIAAGMSDSGGLISLEDLAGYEVVVRKPIKFEFLGNVIYSMPPPSSGGVHIAQILKSTANAHRMFPPSSNAEEIHIFSESMRRAYADRASYLGDPDFIEVPVDRLVSSEYLEERMGSFDPNQATPSSSLSAGELVVGYESNDTTHFSVVDQSGNAVSNTYTLNFSFGSGKMIEGTGFLLNNQMDDFSSKPGAPNAYGLLGSDANAIEPEKRMLSSMSPTIVTKDGEIRLVTGSPGGSTIITSVSQILWNVLYEGMDLETATSELRIHHQWNPDEIKVERGTLLDVQIRQLEGKGHRVEEVNSLGTMNSVEFVDGVYMGVSDSRNPTGVALGL